MLVKGLLSGFVGEKDGNGYRNVNMSLHFPVLAAK